MGAVDGHCHRLVVDGPERRCVVAFREIPMFEVREVLRLWLGGHGFRAIAPLVRPDRKTVRRIVETAIDAGLDRAGGDGQLDDVFVGRVMMALRPERGDRHGDAWVTIAGLHGRVGLPLTSRDRVRGFSVHS